MIIVGLTTDLYCDGKTAELMLEKNWDELTNSDWSKLANEMAIIEKAGWHIKCDGAWELEEPDSYCVVIAARPPIDVVSSSKEEDPVKYPRP